MQSRNLSDDQINHIEKNYQTPCYVYHEDDLRQQAEKLIAFPNAYGLKVRYAMKANPNANILRLFASYGIGIDASSSYEAYRAIAAWVNAEDIQLSSQQVPDNYSLLDDHAISFVATSLYQIDRAGQWKKKDQIGIRVNPGIWSWAFAKIATGGLTSSFGIWHEYLPEAFEKAKDVDVTIHKLHFHIGSENTAESRAQAAQNALDIAENYDSIDTINLWWWFKIAIMDYEKTANIQAIGKAVQEKFEAFEGKTGRKLTLEIEPGKYLVMNSCCVLAKAIDIVNTWSDGHRFLKLNTGMNEMPRMCMYGVQQPIEIRNNQTEKTDYVVVWHACESGDLLTCKLYEPETIETRSLPKAKIGDTVIIKSCGAYNAGMAIKHYNSYPEAWELLIRSDKSIVEIRKREEKQAVRKNETLVIEK